MNTKVILASVIAVSITAAAILLSNVRFPIAADSLIGYTAVASIAVMAALEYGMAGRRRLSK